MQLGSIKSCNTGRGPAWVEPVEQRQALLFACAELLTLALESRRIHAGVILFFRGIIKAPETGWLRLKPEPASCAILR
jgi:hypothetical protein